MTTKLVITGGLGFIFSHVTEYFVSKGWEVLVIDNQDAGSHPEIIDESFKYLNLNAGSPEALKAIVEFNPDYIIHASAISDVDTSIKYPFDVIESNTKANLVVFEASKKCPNLKKLLYVSTDEVYGECEYKKTEEDIIFPKNPYSMSKAHGSLLRIAYDNTYPELKNKTTEIRMCNIFGPRQDKRKIFPAIKESLQGNYSIPIHEGGTGFREYLYVKNVPPVIELVLEKGDRTYNITLNDGYTVNEIIELSEKLTGKKCLTHKGERQGMDLKYQMDNSRIISLGWKPLYSFEEGLQEYLND